MEENQEDYRSKGKSKKLSMKQIILQQIQKIMEFGSQEMRGGYEEENIIMIDGQPQIVKKYIDDGRQAFCNAVSLLDSAVTSYVVDDDNPKQSELLKDLNMVKEEQREKYKKYVQDLGIKNIDMQEVKFKYFTEKKKIFERMFKKLMTILRRSDFFDDEEDRE